MIAALLALLAIVSTSTSSVSYACDGVTATYAVTFPYLAYTDLAITSTTPAGSATTLTYTTDYTVDRTSTSSTATLTLTSPATKCPAGNTLKIARILSLTQPYSFKAQTTFNPSLHETAYDRLVMEIQQLNASFGTGGVLAEANGGTGNTGLTCAAGSVLTSNGTAYSCSAITPTCTAGQVVSGNGSAFSCSSVTPNCPAGQVVTANGSSFSCTVPPVQPIDQTTTRTGWSSIWGTGDSTFSVVALPAVQTTSNANISYANDPNTDTTRVMLKGSVAAVGTQAAWYAASVTKRQYLPKFVTKVWVPSLGAVNAQDRFVYAGLMSIAPSTTGAGQICAAQSQTNGGAWICYVTASIAGYAGAGTNWGYVRGDATATVNSDSGIPVTVGLHTLTVDYSVAGQVTFTVDNSTPATFNASLPPATTALDPVVACGTWATLAAYSCSSPGFQVQQTF